MTNNGRDATGRFAEGNPGGPGRPAITIERAYLRVLSEACSPADWREIVGQTVSAARNGDAKAREWLGRYLLGRPADDALTQLAAEERLDVDPVAARTNTVKTGNTLDDLMRSL